MRRKTNESIKTNAFNQELKIKKPRTRTYIKQETEDSKENLKCALYSPVKTESSSLEISNHENNTRTASSKDVRNRHCDICNITFSRRDHYFAHELHSHKTKEIPNIDLKTRRCNICNKRFTTITFYRQHMAKLNNIHIPLKLKLKPNPSITPDFKDPNNYCLSCNFTFKSRSSYYKHLVLTHQMSRTSPSEKSHNPKNTKPKIDTLNLYCDHCDKEYDAKAVYIRHLVRVHEMILPDAYSEPSNFDSEKLCCKVCDKTFRKKRQFTGHLRSIHHVELSFRCDSVPDTYDQNNYCVTCDRTFCTKTSYAKHLVINHLDKQPELYQGIDCKNPSKWDLKHEKYCVDCQKVFLLKKLYQIHMDKIHGIKPLQHLPNVNGPGADNSNNHCNLCDKTFANIASYKDHLFYTHNLDAKYTFKKRIMNRNIALVVDLIKKYCNVCDRIYKTQHSYQKHIYRYHNVKTSKTQSPVNRNKIPVIDEIGRTCSSCDRVYKNRAIYKRHLRDIHNILLPKKKCGAMQTDSYTLTNEGNKAKHCSLCNKTYSRRVTFLRHLAVIHNMKKQEVKQEDTDEKLRI